jgi:hypothetical protein
MESDFRFIRLNGQKPCIYGVYQEYVEIWDIVRPEKAFAATRDELPETRDVPGNTERLATLLKDSDRIIAFSKHHLRPSLTAVLKPRPPNAVESYYNSRLHGNVHSDFVCDGRAVGDSEKS